MTQTNSYRRFQARQTTTDTSDVTLAAAPGPKLKLCITKCSLSNSHASTNTQVHLKSGGSIIWTFTVPAAGGNEPVFPDALECNENEALTAASVNSASTVTICVSGHIISA